MQRRLIWTILLTCCALITILIAKPGWLPGGDFLLLKLRGRATVTDRLNQYGPAARNRLKPYFEKAGVTYPPHKIVLVGLKKEKSLQLYGAGESGALKFIHAYPVLAASGVKGPKLEEGDGQVPEGFYKIEALNPNSAFHLALRVNYPSETDRKHAAEDGRANPGTDIMIHGSHGSVGCLAMGDPVSEELFVLAGDTGLENIDLILCPEDFRRNKNCAPPPKAPAWTGQLYRDLAAALAKLPATTEQP